MAVGLTTEGFVARRQPEILEELIARLQADDELGGLNFRAGALHVLLGIISELQAQAWEAAEEVYASQYAAASGVSLDHVAALTGTVRRAATRSTVEATVNLDAGTTLPQGSIAARAGAPDVQFRTTEAVTNSGGAPANVTVLMEALETGPVAAPSGTLTVIPSPVGGWNSVTNASDADLGQDVADDAELREQRIVELAGVGASTVPAIRAAVARVEGVEEVAVYENVTLSVDGDGRPAKSVEVVLWDGVSMAADDDGIAQTIWETVCAGIEIHGVGESGTAIDAETLDTHTVAFTRASEVRVYLEATVVLVPGAVSGWETPAIEALAARSQEYTVGETAYASQLSCVLLAQDAVAAVVDLTIGTAPSPAGTSVAVAYDEIVRIDTADITVGT